MGLLKHSIVISKPYKPIQTYIFWTPFSKRNNLLITSIKSFTSNLVVNSLIFRFNFILQFINSAISDTVSPTDILKLLAGGYFPIVLEDCAKVNARCVFTVKVFVGVRLSFILDFY